MSITLPAFGSVLSTDTVSSEEVQRVKVTFGANNAATLVERTAPLPVSEYQVAQTYSVAGVIAINTVLLTIDLDAHESASIHCISMGTSGVVTPEWSNNDTNWVAATLFTAAGASATTFNAAGLWVVQRMARYVRLRLSTATTAGTTSLAVAASPTPIVPFLATQPVSGTVTANQGTRATPSVLFRNSTADTNLATIKATAGTLYGITINNANASTRFLKLYNKGSNPVLASDTPVLVIPIPANSTAVQDYGFGLRFGTGIAMAITAAVGDTDTTAVAAGEHKLGVSYL